MKIGFTGTRHGTTPAQRQAINAFLNKLSAGEGNEGHHGDCIGADEDFNALTLSRPSFRRVIHPPSNRAARAFCSTLPGDVIRRPMPFIERNHRIVEECDLLIVAPEGMTEELRSGTWATWRYARKLHKPYIVAFPDGTTTDITGDLTGIGNGGGE